MNLYASMARRSTRKARILAPPMLREDTSSRATCRPDHNQRDYTGQFAHLSLEPVKAFVARDALHDQIHTQLNSHAAEASTTTLVVWGLGGAGKTQLVLDYVQRHRTEYKATFWMEVASKESPERDFINLYRMLFGLATVAGTETINIDDAVTGVKSWFSGRQGPWLMVFDGADAIDDSKTHDFIDLKHFIPDVASLRVIVTSRSSAAADMTRLEGVQVGEMEGAHAVELFYRYTRLPCDNVEIHEEVKEIVKELGCLALAVALAGAYVGATPRLQSNIKAYLPEYMQRRQDLLQRKPESLVHQYSESVLTTWETSYQAVAEQCPEASVLMTMLSFLSFDDIFPDLFIVNEQMEIANEEEEEEEANWRSLISPEQPLDRYKVEECFRVLQKYSLVQWKADQQSYAIHKLVHAWGCDRLLEAEQRKFSLVAFELIVQAVNSCGKAPEDKLRLVPHVMANFSALAKVGGTCISGRAAEGALNSMESVGMFLRGIGRWWEELMIRTFLFNKRCTLLGEEHPDTITAMSNLSITLARQGQLEEAATMFRKVLIKRRHILGDNHPDTMKTMNNLATTLRDQGHLKEAAKMLKDVLEKMRRVLGDDHLSTISAMNNLAISLEDEGCLKDATEMKTAVLEKRRRILGDEHPDTISAMKNLANTLANMGQLEKAAKMLKEVLEKMKRILGDEHPDTISTMNNLAMTIRDQDYLKEAVKMLKEVLEKRRRILGEEHPDTISAMHNLARTLADMGQFEEAAKIERKVLDKRWRILGEEHPHTISAMNNLAITLRDQGHAKEAAMILKEVLEKRRHILDDDHPDTISAMSNLAISLEDQGQLEEAAKMKREVLEKRRCILGEEHPDTATAMNNLAITIGALGERNKMEKMFQDVPEKMTRILSAVSPESYWGMLITSAKTPSPMFTRLIAAIFTHFDKNSARVLHPTDFCALMSASGYTNETFPPLAITVNPSPLPFQLHQLDAWLTNWYWTFPLDHYMTTRQFVTPPPVQPHNGRIRLRDRLMQTMMYPSAPVVPNNSSMLSQRGLEQYFTSRGVMDPTDLATRVNNILSVLPELTDPETGQPFKIRLIPRVCFPMMPHPEEEQRRLVAQSQAVAWY